MGTETDIDRVEVHVEGTDAMMIDRAWLKEWHGRGMCQWTEVIDKWGLDNDKGWCISEDPDDINGWSGSASQCSPGVAFTVGGSVDYLETHDYFRSYNYCLDLKTDGVSVSDALTDSPIYFRIFKGSRKIYEDWLHSGWEFPSLGYNWMCLKLDEADLPSKDDNCNAIVPSDWDGTSFQLDIDGSDAFLIDRVKKETFGSNKVQYWGANNGYGWCLSTDPDDINGSFSGHAESCNKCIQWFDNGDVKRC